jgi:KGK domain
MEFNYYLQKCDEKDVLAVGNQMIKIGKFKYILDNAFSPSDIRHSKVANAINEHFKSSAVELYAGDLILQRGIRCEILRIGSKGWQQGKIRVNVTLEFIPDEPETEVLTVSEQPEISKPESPLDDLRRMMNQENQK